MSKLSSAGAIKSFLAIGLALVLMCCVKAENKNLMKACKENRLEEVQRLLNSGADANARDIEGTRGEGGTALMWAALGGYLDIVNLLLERGAGVHHCFHSKLKPSPGRTSWTRLHLRIE